MAELAWDRTSRPHDFAWPRRSPTRTPVRGVPHEPQRPTRRHRTIFISDVHLGTRGCKADLLADFLVRNSCETLFLVGDIVDGWRLKRRWYWPDAHNRVIEALLRKIDAGTRVVYVPGNHDEMLRNYCGRSIAGVEVMYEAVHETADGRQLAWRPVRRGHRLCQMARASRRRRLHAGSASERGLPHAAARIEPALLVAIRLAEREGQERT